MDKIEFERIFKDNYGQMYRLAMSILADSEECHDIVHDVFARLLDGKTIVRRDTIGAFLMINVRNQCLNTIKHKSVHERFEKLYTPQIAEETADNELYTERMEQLSAFIESRFTDRMKQVLRMKYISNMKYAEIAEALHISKTAVYKNLSHCLEELKTNFKGDLS